MRSPLRTLKRSPQVLYSSPWKPARGAKEQRRLGYCSQIRRNNRSGGPSVKGEVPQFGRDPAKKRRGVMGEPGIIIGGATTALKKILLRAKGARALEEPRMP